MLLTGSSSAAIVVLYRPAIDFQSAPDNSKSPTELEALKKARAAAAKTNRVVERLIELDLVHYLRPMKSVTVALFEVMACLLTTLVSPL